MFIERRRHSVLSQLDSLPSLLKDEFVCKKPVGVEMAKAHDEKGCKCNKRGGKKNIKK